MSEYIYERPDEPAKVVRDGWNVRIEWDFKQRERIVRCRDCAYYDGEPDLESSMPKCWRDPEHRGAAVWTQPDGFCAWGEPREGVGE